MMMGRFCHRALVLLAVLWLAGACTEAQFLLQAKKSLGIRGEPGANTAMERGGEAAYEAGYGARYKVGSPYKIKEIWYYPQEDYDYVEEGIASWYGPNFHGKKTANGAIFDMHRVSAAHRTLPMPSRVRVTNLENGRMIELTVNDRGPFSGNRIIDLSKRAAQLLDFEIQGTALVRVEILPEESRRLAQAMQGGGDGPAAIGDGVVAAPAVAVTSESLQPPPGVSESRAPTPRHAVPQRNLPSPTLLARDTGGDGVMLSDAPVTVRVQAVPPQPDVYVQAGAFAQHLNAVKAQALLQSLGTAIIRQYNQSATPLFRVRVGPVASAENADRLLGAVQRAGFPDAHIVVDKMQ